MRSFPYFLIITCSLLSCVMSEDDANQRFEAIDPAHSNVDFENTLTVNDSMNFFTYGYFYMGGGVATGDVNNDGLADLFFTGNMVSNEMYLNKGNLQFEKVTEKAGVGADDRWITGCAFTDINADGWLDIYVSVAGKWKSRKNILYINQGLNADGVPIFLDMAENYGVADEGNSIQSTFLDYDGDGDLDLFVANYEITSFNILSHDYKRLIDNVTHAESDHLYRNNGDNTFTDVTETAGLMAFGLTVGVIASDFNNDGHTDLYLSNDFNTPDFFYINNGDGTFTDQLQESTRHTAFYGMGVDAADYNNDGLLDIMQVDMTPEDNFRSKANMASMDITGFWNNVNYGFHHQYMYNTLQRCMGIREDGTPLYGDVAKISGMDKTDWSWSALFADYDNDGYKDLYITNGTRKDINNKDFFKWLERVDTNLKLKYKELSIYDLMDKIPSKKVDNYAFKNIGGDRFEKQNKTWNLNYNGFSNGAAYCDLDNDGDLEIIVNNIDSVAMIFNNYSTELGEAGYLKLELKGPVKNPLALGTKVYLTTDSLSIYHEHTLVRGFQSSVDPVLHFGIGNAQSIEELKVVWPDNTSSVYRGLEINQLLTVRHAYDGKPNFEMKGSPTVFQQLSASKTEPAFVHMENNFNDFERELLLPHKMSQFGPAFGVGDVNNDNLQDYYIGGAMDQPGAIYLQTQEGKFVLFPQSAFIEDAFYEDVDMVFVDMEGDGDQDMYVVSGGNELPEGDRVYQDRIYFNDGQGMFSKVKEALPLGFESGSCVVPFDFDMDGDKDLFIGGRQVPGKYPLPSSSKILLNVSENLEIKFEDITKVAAPELEKIGMVTDALWSDYDQDGDADLMLVGEWMPITILENSGKNTWKEVKVNTLLETVGWWNTITTADFDNDGDEDFLVGNLGLNYKYKATKEETFDVYVNDYDTNGNLDIVLGYYQDGIQFPVRGKQCSTEQIPALNRKFSKYNKFAAASLGDIYTENLLDNALHYQAKEFASIYIENRGNGEFAIHELPTDAQISSINAFQVLDYNVDGNLDFIAGGNFYQSEVETPRNDASYGWLFEGNGSGQFEYVPLNVSGIDVPFDTRKIEMLKTNDQIVVLFANNNGPLTGFTLPK